jgi:glycosyltransferase involved in cell wall biosynthesis
MKIDVVIPTYDRPQKLARALRSVLEQTEPVSRIIVVDNGTNVMTVAAVDEARGAVRHGEEILYIRSKPFDGRAALAEGIANVASPWLILLDDDDFFVPKRVQEDNDAISGISDEVVLLQHAFYRVDFLHGQAWKHEVVPSRLSLADALMLRGFGPPPSCTIRSSVAKAVHPFKNSEGWFDYDFYVCLLQHGSAFAVNTTGYIMDDTRLAKRETSGVDRLVRVTLIHWSRYKDIARQADIDPAIMQKRIEGEAAFYVGKAMGISGIGGRYRKLALQNPIQFLKGISSPARRIVGRYLPFSFRGSRSLTIEDVQMEIAAPMGWLLKQRINGA